MNFKDWIFKYYGMLLSKFLDSELVKNISFTDLVNAFNAGAQSKFAKPPINFYIAIDGKGQIYSMDDLLPDFVELAMAGKVVLIDCPRKLYFTPDEWISLTEGGNSEEQ